MSDGILDAMKAFAYGGLNTSYKENEGVTCVAKPGECRFLYPYNSKQSGCFWDDPIPKRECRDSGCCFVYDEKEEER